MDKQNNTPNTEEFNVMRLEAEKKILLLENNQLKREIRELKKRITELESKALINPRKVTEEQVKRIKKLRAAGLSYRAIAKETTLSTCTIQRALKGVYD